ncbi:hypothetical protein FRC01_004348, partial [Tulasnella sp. 417]
MDLIGGCISDPKEGYEVSNQVCTEWVICLASMTLLEVALMANYTTIELTRYGDDYYDWADCCRQERQRKRGNAKTLARLPRTLTAPLPPLQISLSTPEPEPIYDIPAGGPNYSESLLSQNRASGSPYAAPSPAPG